MARLFAYILHLSAACYVCCGPSEPDPAEGYDPTELLTKIFDVNTTSIQRARFPSHFEDDVTNNAGNFDNNGIDNTNIDENMRPVKFVDDLSSDFSGSPETHDNRLKKKRRRRKPKRNPEVYLPQQYDGISNYYQQTSGQNLLSRPQRPLPSLASQALSSVTAALTSIARYDDHQCVPRLLCESASGGALGNPQVLQSMSGLQPLLTLLSAYNGISTNPLFVFGRAVFLGMSSQGKPASCRYAYPLCPTDTEQLVHYLNNHNGGFFRFFNGRPQGHQTNIGTLSQLYNHLSQNYEQNQPIQDNQNYNGLYPVNKESYGIYKPISYSTPNEGYGPAYPHSYYTNIRLRANNNNSKIEKRIQNNPVGNVFKNHADTVWKFPARNQDQVDLYNNDYYLDEDMFEGNHNIESYEGNAFKFPETIPNTYKDTDDIRKTRGFLFPENPNPNYISNDGSQYTHNPNENFVFGYHNQPDHLLDDYIHYGNKHKLYNYVNTNIIDLKRDVKKHTNDNVQTVYVVRGNGDPSRPEIIRLKPGQSIREVY